MMNYDKRTKLLQEVQKEIWVERVFAALVDGWMCSWVTTLHPNQLQCRLDGGFPSGSHNLCQKFVFIDNATWLLRFLRVDAICKKYVDEKTAI